MSGKARRLAFRWDRTENWDETVIRCSCAFEAQRDEGLGAGVWVALTGGEIRRFANDGQLLRLLCATTSHRRSR
ncbi:MAG: hypothetical protein A2341_13950 [Deltaproteobacteria bacterium RIFOXYB12_FULL_58_9]|nr:MAG: hypothetical protein A2341_13950 [Deltaproteobacteria bacterium RIFOXYB12_FULL_58_9]